MLLDIHFPSVLHVNLDEVDQSQIEPYTPATRSTVTEHTIDPAHLLLNLHILAFIECARTIPLPYYSPSRSHRQDRAVFTSYTSVECRGNGYAQQNEGRPVLLSKARLLFTEAKRLLKPADRFVYLGELARVTAVISHTHPEKSDLAQYFSQARRRAVANQIERAILCEWTKIACVSVLILCKTDKELLTFKSSCSSEAMRAVQADQLRENS